MGLKGKDRECSDYACTTSMVAARCWSGAHGLELDITVHLCKALRAVFQWGSCWREHGTIRVCQALDSTTGPVGAALGSPKALV